MTARPTILTLAASLALAPALLAQDHAVPRGGGSGGSGGGGSHPSPGVHSSGGGSSSSPGYSPGSSSTGSSAPSTAERRHPRAGTGRGSGGGYYPGYPSYPGYPGWGGGYYPGYWGSWWPYGSYGWYGGYWGYPWGWGGGGGTVYHYVQREGGSVRVLVDPAEARVYVDGYYAGTVDDFDGLFQRLNVSPGRHEIALKLEGYKTHRMKVYVAPDATVKLHYDMEKGAGETFEDLARDVPEAEVRRPRETEERWEADEARAEQDELRAVGGRLKLTVRPDDASVYVDGAFRGTAREASELRLAPGRHRIEVVRPGYRTLEREIDVVPGETTRLEIEMERPTV